MAFLLTGLITTAQQAAICIIDSKSKEPIPFANVCFQGLSNGPQKHLLSDLKGNVPYEPREPSRLIVSYMGYETYIDTIIPGKNSIVYLKPTVLNMNEVVVTAQFTPERADKSIYKVNVLSSKLIDQKAVTNLGELLTSESNIHVSQGGALGSNVSMQGFSGENIKFLIDGVPVIGRVNGNIDLNQLNLYNVDHVEIIEGPMSVIYGSNAIAGVINIITRENRNSLLSMYANAYAESVGQYNFNVGVSGRKSKHLFSVDGSRNFFGGIADNKAMRSMKWWPRLQYNADAYYLYDNSRLRLKLTGEYFYEMLLDKGALMVPYFETAFDNTYRTNRLTGILDGSYKIGTDRLFTVLTSFSEYSRLHQNYFKDLTSLEQVVTAKDTTSYNSLMFRAWFNQNKLENKFNYQTGIDLNSDVSTGGRIGGITRKIGEYAYFISGKYDPFKSLSFQPGLRIVYNSNYSAPLIYSLNLRWGATEHTTMRASYAKGYRSPSFKELYMSFKDINHDVSGNPELKAEYGSYFGLNGGYNRETPKDYVNFEMAYSYYDVRNKIQLVVLNTGSLPPVYGYINVSRLKSQSGTLSTSWSFYPKISLKGGVTVVGRHIPGNGGISEYDRYVWNTDISASASYKIVPSNLTFSLFCKRSGKLLKINEDGFFDGGYTAAYTFADFMVSKGFLKNRLTITTGCKNIFDVQDVYSTGTGGAHSGSSGEGSESIAWGRTYFIKLAFSFNKHQ
jgi:outer membrane receptor for ferrienterochelin and colicins